MQVCALKVALHVKGLVKCSTHLQDSLAAHMRQLETGAFGVVSVLYGLTDWFACAKYAWTVSDGVLWYRFAAVL